MRLVLWAPSLIIVLEAIDRGAPPPFQMLLTKYKSHLERDESFAKVRLFSVLQVYQRVSIFCRAGEFSNGTIFQLALATAFFSM